MIPRYRPRPRPRLLTDFGAQVVGCLAWACIATFVIACLVAGRPS